MIYKTININPYSVSIKENTINMELLDYSWMLKYYRFRDANGKIHDSGHRIEIDESITNEQEFLSYLKDKLNVSETA